MNSLKERKTKQKCYILDCFVKNSKNHLTVDNVHNILAKAGVCVGRATIYRCVKNLVKEGILRKYKASQNGCACYQYVNKDQNCDKHCHLVCLNCEKILHFESEVAKQFKETLKKEEGFLLDIPGTSFYGLCSSCAK